MYQGYAGRMGWKLEVLGSDPSDMGGYNEITFLLKGDGVWPHMHFEGGLHRVQRVPVTESQGRIHTSSATVTVLPGGGGGRGRHRPERPPDRRLPLVGAGRAEREHDRLRGPDHPQAHGLVVAMQDEKSQIQNRAKAMQVLRSRLLKLEQDRQAAALSSERKDQVKQRRSLGEDPHLQLQGEPRHRPSHPA